MNRLDTELQRLFFTDGASQFNGGVRLVVLGIAGPADWPALAAVWRGVQADLDLPAPAIVVNGVDAFELWFAFAQPLPVLTATAWLDGLCARYLPDLPVARRRLWPASDLGAQTAPTRIAQQQGQTGRWSALVAPDLAAVFGDDPSLDLAPGTQAQADLLSRIQPICGAGFESAMARLLSKPSLPPSAPDMAQVPSVQHEAPRQFLLEVMNDPSVAMDLRIRAAKALLQP